MRRHHERTALISLLAGAILLAGCGFLGTVGSTGRGTSTVDDGDTTEFEVKSLGLTFTLPDSFQAHEDDDFAFLARSSSPRAVFSIAGDDPTTVDLSARQGETLTSVEIDGVDAVVVTNAAVEDLPSGIVASELRVANGSRSFSVIMSAPERELPMLWDVFIDSVDVETR